MAQTTHVLVIDDDVTVRSVLGRTLRRAGYEVSEAPDAHIGLRLLASHAFDLTLVDIFMPGQGGLTTIQQIRERWPTLKLLAMSGADRLGPMETAAHAQAVGADAFLKKPFEAQTLLSTIDELLKTSPPPPSSS
jgi:DNA-binding NtrC family response regulator